MRGRDQDMTSDRREYDRGRPRAGGQTGVCMCSVLLSRRCRRALGSIPAVFCLAIALCLEIPAAWSESGLPSDGAAVVLTRVVEIAEPDVVILGAGRLDGLTDSARVMLLREGDPIVHPLTGEVLGIPQEPVGRVRVFRLQDHSARARLEHAYSTPAVDDLAEFEKSAPGEPVQVERQVAGPQDGFAARLKELEASVEQYEKSSKKMKSYPTFATRVWEQLTDMRSRLEELDARLVDLEEQQMVDRLQLRSVVSGEYSVDNDAGRRDMMREYSVKQIRLSADGRTLLVTAVDDSLILKETVDDSREQMEEGDDVSERGFLSLLSLYDDEGEGVVATPLPAEGAWYKTRWHLVGGAVSLVLGLTIVVAFVIRKIRRRHGGDGGVGRRLHGRRR